MYILHNYSHNKKYFRQTCSENQNAHFMFNSASENRAYSQTMRKNTAEPNRPQMTIWRMRIACWVTKGKTQNTQNMYLLLSTATMVAGTCLNLLYDCIACLVDVTFRCITSVFFSHGYRAASTMYRKSSACHKKKMSTGV